MNFSVASEKQEQAADEQTLSLLELKKAGAEFERAQEAKERFHKDFDGVDFTSGRRPLKAPADVCTGGSSAA